jgi:hypothetical protein
MFYIYFAQLLLISVVVDSLLCLICLTVPLLINTMKLIFFLSDSINLTAINDRDDVGCPALMIACSRGSSEVCALLLLIGTVNYFLF